MQRVIELIETLIKEHEEDNYCTDYREVEQELDSEKAIFLAYDCGRYETLTNLLNDLKKLV